MSLSYDKGDRVNDGILVYVGQPPVKTHECAPPVDRSDIPIGSVWWCLRCDWQWVKERTGKWSKWRLKPG